MMIIECIHPDSFTLNKGGRTKHFKPGSQMQVTDKLGTHLLTTGKWKLIEGQLQTKEEQATLAEWKAQSEEAPDKEEPQAKPIKKKEKK